MVESRFSGPSTDLKPGHELVRPWEVDKVSRCDTIVEETIHILHVVGARPNFVRALPVVRARGFPTSGFVTITQNRLLLPPGCLDVSSSENAASVGDTLRPSAQQVDFLLPGWKLLLVGVVTGIPKFQLTLFCPRAGIFASSSSAP
jgi:hypothetical protein